MDRKDLKLEHYKQRVAELSVQYEERIADLRVELTELSNANTELQQKVLDLEFEANAHDSGEDEGENIVLEENEDGSFS